MARSYAKLYVSVWSSDFRALTREAQHLYFLLVSNPKLSSAGCVVCQPRKWAKYAADCTGDEIAEALEELIDHRYVLHDDDTDEVLIRSFIRHDRGFRNQYLRKSIETSVAAIESDRLRETARLELAAAIEDAASPQVEDSEQGSDEGSEQDSPEANYRPHPQPTPTDFHPSPRSDAAESDDATDQSPTGKGGGVAHSRVDAIAEAYASHALATAKARGHVRSERGYLAKAVQSAIENPDLQRLAALFPTAPASVIAAAMNGEKGSLQYYPRADELATVTELRPA